MWGVQHGFVAPARGIDPFARVQVCSVQSMGRKIDRYHARPFDFLIVDEAHHAAMNTTWGAVIQAHAGKRILGVTATPARLGGEPLTAFETMVVGPTVAELIELGALTPYSLFCPPSADMSNVTRRGGDFAKDQTEGVMDKPTVTGDAVREYMRRARGRRAMAFCVSVAHAKHVAASFLASGIPAEAIDGKMDRADRRASISRFKAGETLVLTSADLVSEGFDVPAIEAAILLRPTQSLALCLQQVGRALRPFPGKDRAVILDHAGNLGPNGRHGLPDDDREWTLDGRVKGRGSAGEKTIPMSQCDQCFFTGRPFVICPSCGHERKVEGRKIEEVEGELTEIDLEAARTAKRVEQARAKTLDELIALGVSRQYRNPRAWAIHLLNARGQRA
jgi:superfamily II DNA or RNA helicase